MHELATEHGFTPHIRTRGEEIADRLHTPGWRARRWVVEACHSWLNRNRRSSPDGPRKTRTTSLYSNSPPA